jgi:hypothetical protein
VKEGEREGEALVSELQRRKLNERERVSGNLV